MAKAEPVTAYSPFIETRLTRLEVSSSTLQDDIKEIKRNLRWLMGLVFGINTTIISLLAKGFNIV